MFTIFGADGFIGSALARELDAARTAYRIAPRDADPATLGDLGHAVFCVGVTADFRTRPYDTMEAHVTLPARILARASFDSFLYLSSTRVYDGAREGVETAEIAVNPNDPSDLYNLSKLSGEALCLNHPNAGVRVARLSNVYGEDMFGDGPGCANFLADIVGDAVRRGQVDLGTHPASSKDYIDVADVARALVAISEGGTERLYNIASGKRHSHGTILDAVSGLTGCRVSTDENAPLVGYPDISTERLSRLYAETGAGWAPLNLTDRLAGLVAAAQRKWHIKEGAAA